MSLDISLMVTKPLDAVAEARRRPMTDTASLLSAVNDYALTTIFSVEEAEIVQSFTAMLMKRLTNEIEENFLRR